MHASNKSASLANSINNSSANSISNNSNNNSNNNANRVPLPSTNSAINVLQQMHYNANIPIASQNGTGLLNQGAGGIIPPILLEESRVPRFYKDAIARCGAPHTNQLPHTALVYNLMVTSRLPRPVLGNIWSLVNRTLPGQLTRQEFFSCLALIALAQRGQTLSALSNVSVLPIPNFQACAPFPQTHQAQLHPTIQPHPQISNQANEAQQQTHTALINASVLAGNLLPPPTNTRTLPVQIGVPIRQKNLNYNLPSSNMIPSMYNNTKQSSNKTSANAMIAKNSTVCNLLSNAPTSDASLTPSQASTSNVASNSLSSSHKQQPTQTIPQANAMTIPQQSSFINSLNPPHLNNLNFMSTNNAIPKTSESTTITSTSSVQSKNCDHLNDPNSYQSLSSDNILSSVIINQKMPHSLTTPAISLSQQQQHQHITSSPSSSLSSTNRLQGDFALFPSNSDNTNNQLLQQKLPYNTVPTTMSAMPTTQSNSISLTNFNCSNAFNNPSAVSSNKVQSSNFFTGYAKAPLPNSNSVSREVLSNKQQLNSTVTSSSSINSLDSSSKNTNIQSQLKISGGPNQNNLDLLCDISFDQHPQQSLPKAHTIQETSNSMQSISLSAVADQTNEQFGDFTSSSTKPTTVPSNALLNPQPIVPISLNSEVFSNEKQEAEDIYAVMKAVEGDVQGSEQERESVRVWKRCIQEAYCLFKDADQLLPIASEMFINDIAHTERGAKYLSALRAIYEMVSRIRKGRVEELREVESELHEIDRIWLRIKRYTVEQSTINESNQTPSNNDPSAGSAISKQCGICVMQINETDLLEFAGTSYHRQCANLWINRIDSLLPKLS